MLFKLFQLCFSLLPVILYPLLAARKDYFQIEANGVWDSLKKTFHQVNVYIRILIFGCLGLLAFQNVYVLVSYWLLASAAFWVLFDRRLNKYRGLPLNYVGQTSDLDVIIRNFGAKHNKQPERIAASFKLICLLFSVLVFVAANYLKGI